MGTFFTLRKIIYPKFPNRHQGERQIGNGKRRRRRQFNSHSSRTMQTHLALFLPSFLILVESGLAEVGESCNRKDQSFEGK